MTPPRLQEPGRQLISVVPPLAAVLSPVLGSGSGSGGDGRGWTAADRFHGLSGHCLNNPRSLIRLGLQWPACSDAVLDIVEASLTTEAVQRCKLLRIGRRPYRGLGGLGIRGWTRC